MEKKISVRQGKEVRLDKYLLGLGLGLSRSKIQKLISNNGVLINGKPAKPHHIVHSGEILSIKYEQKKPVEIEPENIPVDIVYEDNELLVVNKASGMVVHPARGNFHGTLVNALLYHTSRGLAESDDYTKPGVVHRIDKETSGLLVFAKTERIHSELARQVQDRIMKRIYLLLVWGVLPTDKGIIEAPIGRNTLDRKKMKVTPFASRKAITHFRVIERFNIATYIRAQLETGRTHQIRVHFSHMGYPVIGDPNYDGRRLSVLVDIGKHNKDKFDLILKKLKRQALHATSLSFYHPRKKKTMVFYAPLPNDIKEVLQILHKNCVQ
ncbi:RluA family pseudouridine synthase [candidate division WOR-3 bacterium]|nr:RluA family pseudouridine synthase [candidate division WOR-3 bacterium]